MRDKTWFDGQLLDCPAVIDFAAYANARYLDCHDSLSLLVDRFEIGICAKKKPMGIKYREFWELIHCVEEMGCREWVLCIWSNGAVAQSSPKRTRTSRASGARTHGAASQRCGFQFNSFLG